MAGKKGGERPITTAREKRRRRAHRIRLKRLRILRRRSKSGAVAGGGNASGINRPSDAAPADRRRPPAVKESGERASGVPLRCLEVDRAKTRVRAAGYLGDTYDSITRPIRVIGA
jgi:hypothetical protein